MRKIIIIFLHNEKKNNYFSHNKKNKKFFSYIEKIYFLEVLIKDIINIIFIFNALVIGPVEE